MAYELVMGCIRGTPLETANIVLACQVDGAMEGWGVADELMDGEEGEEEPTSIIYRDEAVMPVEPKMANFHPAKVTLLSGSSSPTEPKPKPEPEPRPEAGPDPAA